MGLIKAGIDAVMGTLKDQWKEYFYCEALPVDVLVSKGQKKVQRGGNKGDDNAISDGSVIAVADGQFIIIVENGAIVQENLENLFIEIMYNQVYLREMKNLVLN